MITEKRKPTKHEDHFHDWILHISKTKLWTMIAYTGQLQKCMFFMLALCEHYCLPQPFTFIMFWFLRESRLFMTAS